MTDFDQPAFAPESEKVARGAGLAQRSASGCAFQIKTRFKECLQKTLFGLQLQIFVVSTLSVIWYS